MSDQGASDDLRHVSAAIRLQREWLKASPTEREQLRAAWPTLADALDALCWRPAPEGVGAGTPPAPVAPQGRSERATRQAGDMHEPRQYPASRLHFE